jgi:hypothetical protein
MPGLPWKGRTAHDVGMQLQEQRQLHAPDRRRHFRLFVMFKQQLQQLSLRAVLPDV